jgi:hypothetical protein
MPGTPASRYALRSTTTGGYWHPTRQSGNINTNNNRPEVGPLQTIAPGPVQAIVFRHRLNRGGDHQVNNAIHTIALIRAKHQPETRAYLDRRITEGKTKREAMRALKRHISRDLFKRIADVPLTS